MREQFTKLDSREALIGFACLLAWSDLALKSRLRHTLELGESTVVAMRRRTYQKSLARETILAFVDRRARTKVPDGLMIDGSVTEIAKSLLQTFIDIQKHI